MYSINWPLSLIFWKTRFRSVRFALSRAHSTDEVESLPGDLEASLYSLQGDTPQVTHIHVVEHVYSLFDVYKMHLDV